MKAINKWFNLNKKTVVLKNLISYSIVSMMLATSINGINSVQSVLNQSSGLGIVSELMIFSFQLLFSLVLPQMLCEIIGFKWSTIVSEVAAILYVSANFYPRWATLIPSKLLNCNIYNLKLLIYISKFKSICY